jgi:WhiB family redox-sensing transcriptional regulator
MTRPDRARSEKDARQPGHPRAVGRAGAVHPGDPDAWFPEKGERGLAAIVKRICGHCPVRTQCPDYVLSGADTWTGIAIATGFWGGIRPQERGQLRQQRRALAA